MLESRIIRPAAQICRALPNLVTFAGWRRCDHTAPVFEGDILSSELTVEEKHPLDRGGGLLDLSVQVSAERGPEAPEPGQSARVLDWRVIVAMA